MKQLENHHFTDVSDFEDHCDELLTDFMETLEHDSRYTRIPTAEEIEEFDFSIRFMFTDKGHYLMDRYQERLHKLGESLFPDEELEIKCSGIIEP